MGAIWSWAAAIRAEAAKGDAALPASARGPSLRSSRRFKEIVSNTGEKDWTHRAAFESSSHAAGRDSNCAGKRFVSDFQLAEEHAMSIDVIELAMPVTGKGLMRFSELSSRA
jgi:hypothetical protein